MEKIMSYIKNHLELIDMDLTQVMSECERIGIDIVMHSELIEEMYWDGFHAVEIKEMIEVEQDRDHYAYIPSL
jgi:hypothetical protein